MKNTANEQLIMDFFDEMQGPTITEVVAAYTRYFHPQGVWKNSGFPDLVGHAAIVHLLREQEKLFDFAKVRVLDHRLLASDGDHVFFERRDSIVNSRDEVVYAFDIAGIFKIEQGLIVEWRDYMDTSQFKAAWAQQDQASLASLS